MNHARASNNLLNLITQRKKMSLLINIILATTEEERAQAIEALEMHNAAAPSDRELVLEFLKKCTDLDGAPLTLDDDGRITTLQ
jgi:hypothetical protein